MFGCILTENCECVITVFMINIIKYFSFNSSFLSDVTCGISPISTTTYSLFRVGEPCVANCILKTEREVGARTPVHHYNLNGVFTILNNGELCEEYIGGSLSLFAL